MRSRWEPSILSFLSLLSFPQPPPVEAAVLNGLAHMLRLEVRRTLQVGEGAGDLENPVIGPGRQREPRDRRAQPRVGAVRYATERADVARGHVRVGIDAQPVREPLPLRRARPVHPLPHGLARLAAALVRQRAVLHGGHLEMDVDAVEQGPRNAGEGTLHTERSPDTIVLRIAEVAARARIHRRGEHEARGSVEAHLRENGGEPSGEHRFAAAWRADHQAGVILDPLIYFGPPLCGGSSEGTGQAAPDSVLLSPVLHP